MHEGYGKGPHRERANTPLGRAAVAARHFLAFSMIRR